MLSFRKFTFPEEMYDTGHSLIKFDEKYITCIHQNKLRNQHNVAGYFRNSNR